MESAVVRDRMRRIVLAFLFFTFGIFAVSQSSATQSVLLAWDPSPGPGVAGYNAYYGTASGNYTSILPAGNGTNVVISGLVEGVKYYFAVTAYDSANIESDLSSEVSYLVSSSSPTITSIGNQTVQENSSTLPIQFVVADPDTPVTSLTLSATSSNPSLAPVSNIVFGGLDSNRTVQITPVVGQTGAATIGITVDDGAGHTAQTSFLLTVLAPPQPPVIGSVNDQMVLMNSSTAFIPFTIGDPDTPVGSLTLSGSSSSSSLVPTANIVFGGSGANRTVRVSPAANQFGTATIVIVVNDGTGNSAQSSFVLTVVAAPSITSVTNQTIQENNSTADLPFVIGDADTPVDSLNVSATSSNPTLAPLANIVFGGSGSNRTVRVTPATNQIGTAIIGIVVNDGQGHNAQTTFTLSVAAPPQPPTISSIADQTIQENASTIYLPFLIGDPDTAIGSLTLSSWSSSTSLVPPANIVFGGSGSNRTVRVTPAPDQFGSATIGIIVNDNSGNTSQTTFSLTVLSNAVVSRPPVISSIANQTIQEDSSTALLSFVVADPDTPAANLTVSGSSSVPTLVPPENIMFGGTGSNRTVRVTPAANQFGVATILILVMDDSGNSASTSFTMTVNSNVVTQSPTITAIENQAIKKNTATKTLTFVIGDVDTSVGNLMLTKSSSNAKLVSAAGIVFGGSGANRTVKVTPAANQSGVATINIGVKDNTGNSTSTSFIITVTNPPPMITLVTNGGGSITPNLAVQSLTVGGVYTATATPAAGYLFVNWDGWSSGNTWAAPTVTFTLAPNMVLRANFMPNPYWTVKGKYNGLFFDDAGIALPSAGIFKASITGSGSYSAVLRTAEASYSFSGKMSLDLRSTNSILVGTKAVKLVFQAITTEQGAYISGQFFGLSSVSTVQGIRAVYNATNPAPFLGAYTVILPAADVPTGYGYGTLRIATNGTANFSGKLGDGTAVSQAVAISQDKTWPLFSPLYGGKGFLIGSPQFVNTATMDLAGETIWIKPAIATNRYYRNGFQSESYAFGSLYTPPVGSNTVLNLVGANMNFAGGNLANNFANIITLASSNQVINLSSNKLTMTFAVGNGTFSGKVVDPSSGKTNSFSGAVLQKANAGYGFLLGPNLSSTVSFGQ
jgi:hypothetical protein